MQNSEHSVRGLAAIAILASCAAIMAVSMPAEETPSEITKQQAALHKAAAEHDYERAIELARNVRSLDFTGASGTTVLCEAAHSGAADAYDLVFELLKFGAEPNRGCGSKQAETPLYLAALTGNLAVVDLLIRYGAEIDPEVEPAYYAPIYGAYMGGDKRVIERLEQNGAVMPKAHRDNLRRMQAMSDIVARRPKVEAPKGVDAKEWESQQLEAAIREAYADVPDILAMLGAMAEYRRNNPKPEGIGAEEWRAIQLEAAKKQIYGPQGTFNPNDTRR